MIVMRRGFVLLGVHIVLRLAVPSPLSSSPSSSSPSPSVVVVVVVIAVRLGSLSSGAARTQHQDTIFRILDTRQYAEYEIYDISLFQRGGAKFLSVILIF
jgi:hypothetical protein